MIGGFAVAGYVLALIIFLEVSSAGLWRVLVPPSGAGAFEEGYFSLPRDYAFLPDPFLQYISSSYILEKQRFLTALAERNSSVIYIAALGASTTADGWPQH